LLLRLLWRRRRLLLLLLLLPLLPLLLPLLLLPLLLLSLLLLPLLLLPLLLLPLLLRLRRRRWPTSLLLRLTDVRVRAASCVAGDFLVQLKEMGDSTELYAEERQADMDSKALEMRKRQEAVPGLLNPHVRHDDDMADM
jgi:hypothetical protein